jgi:membrane-bound ClpP family serine protease
MDRDLKNHGKFVSEEIEKYKKLLSDTKDKTEIKDIKKDILDLSNYHQEAVRDFQHERLIHLIVTFFFGGLLILSIIGILALGMTATIYNYSLLSLLVTIIAIVLFITEAFYVRYYFQLENGTQKLYDLTRKLYRLISQ